MINKILVAVDRSESNKFVFDSAVSLAKVTGANLMLLHILCEDEEDYPLLSSYAYYPSLDEENNDSNREKLSEYEQWGLSFLESLAQKAKEAGVDTEYTQLTGYPGQTICEIANSWSSDLIVVGSRGLKGFKEMFLGSVSNYVTHHAHCSVLIVRHALDNQSNQDSLASKTKPIINKQQLTTNQEKSL